MSDEEIFDLADQYGWMDDFGRWNFQPDRLVSFALGVSEKNVGVSDKWVGLTEEERDQLLIEWESKDDWACFDHTIKAIEDKLKEKNA